MTSLTTLPAVHAPAAPTPAARRVAERGSAIFIITVAMVMCAGMAIALVTVAAGRKRSVDGRLAMESAMAIAEAGLDRALIEANNNKTNAAWPTHKTTWNTGTNVEIRSAIDGTSKHGTFVIEYLRGDSDGIDNDGDGQIDLADVTGSTEADYVIVRSTGYYGEITDENPSKVRLESMFLKTINQFNVNSALFIDDLSPDLALSSSAAWKLSGQDHTENGGSVVAASTPLPAVATTGNFNATDKTFMDAKAAKGQITGALTAGKTYSQGITDNVDIAAIVDWATTAADKFTTVGDDAPAGTYPSTPGTGDYKVTYSDSSTVVTGNVSGAGIWIVNGDLTLKGTVKFAGIIIVKGALQLAGGGSGNMLTGAVITSDGASVNYDNNGTTDLKYSSAAVNNAKNAAAKYSVATWEQLPSE